MRTLFLGVPFFFVLPLTNCWSLISHQRRVDNDLSNWAFISSYSTATGSFSLIEIIFCSVFFSLPQNKQKKQQRTKRKRERNSKEHDSKISPLEYFSRFHLNSKTIDDREVNRYNLIVFVTMNNNVSNMKHENQQIKNNCSNIVLKNMHRERFQTGKKKNEYCKVYQRALNDQN